ncbi:hypothetical protein ACFVW1_12105 [Streptomyces olivochromogenes]
MPRSNRGKTRRRNQHLDEARSAVLSGIVSGVVRAVVEWLRAMI